MGDNIGQILKKALLKSLVELVVRDDSDNGDNGDNRDKNELAELQASLSAPQKSTEQENLSDKKSGKSQEGSESNGYVTFKQPQPLESGSYPVSGYYLETHIDNDNNFWILTSDGYNDSGENLSININGPFSVSYPSK